MAVAVRPSLRWAILWIAAPGYSDEAVAFPPAEARATFRGDSPAVKTSSSSMQGSDWSLVARIVSRDHAGLRPARTARRCDRGLTIGRRARVGVGAGRRLEARRGATSTLRQLARRLRAASAPPLRGVGRGDRRARPWLTPAKTAWRP